MRHYILGTAGHIDHGKSSLVKALTGVDPDRLPEEKARGMTIDLGFAHLEFDDPEQADTRYSLGVIDVPGHADFVKNMVAGVGSIDVALFIVAADDAWMPQSEEHLQILTYLGVNRGMIALTKSDLVEDIDFTVEMLRDDLQGTIFADVPIVPTCALKGEGLDDVKAELSKLLRETPEPSDHGKPRLPVDRTFSPQGIGTVVTGTLTGGKFAKGQEAILQPLGLRTTIRNIQNHSSASDEALPGRRTALNLDVNIASREKKEGVRRGDVVTISTLGEPSSTLDVLLEKSERPVSGQPSATKPIKSGQKVRWHHGGANIGARIFFLDEKELEPGGSAIAELRFEEPVYAYTGDRFVLRDWGKRSTIAGGTILEDDANRRSARNAAQLAFLEERAADPDSIANLAASLLARDNVFDRSDFLKKSRYPEAEITAALDQLVTDGKADSQGDLVVNRAWWEEQSTYAGDLIKEHHAKHPELVGLELNKLRPQVEPRLPNKALFDPLIAALCENDCVRMARLIRHKDHEPTLPPELKASAERIRKALLVTPLEPPNPAELAPTETDKKAMKFLRDTAEAIQLSDKAVLSMATYNEAVAAIKAHLEREGKATASDLRQSVNTSRRILIPLLERLDRDGVTRRDGDFRSLK